MRGRALIGVIGLAVLAAACRHTDSPAPPSPSVRIEHLAGTVVRLGTQNGYPLLAVRLRARVCLGSSTEARRTFPDAFEITHFAVVTIDSRRRWFQVRSVVDHPHWLVPFGETWSGACGDVMVDEGIPYHQYVTESLGNQNSCYGVAFAIRAGASRSSKRIIVGCGGLDRLTYRPRRASS